MKWLIGIGILCAIVWYVNKRVKERTGRSILDAIGDIADDVSDFDDD